MRLILFLWVVLFNIPLVVAHHSKDYIQLNSTRLTAQKHVELSILTQWREEVDSTLEIDPAISYGISQYLSAEIHFHLEKNSGKNLENKGTALEFQTLIDHRIFGFKPSFVLEIARVEVEKVLSTNTGTQTGVVIPKARYHAAHFLNANPSTIIVNEQQTSISFEIVASKTFSKGELIFQIGTEKSDDEHNESYGLGYKVKFEKNFSISCELLGPLGKSHGHEIWFACQKKVKGLPMQIGYGRGVGTQQDLNALAFLTGFSF
jgi:hypothetical protein